MAHSRNYSEHRCRGGALGAGEIPSGPLQMTFQVKNWEAVAMLKMFLHTKKWALVAAVSISACAMSGCIESMFRIASDSRLPQGVPIPPGLTRADVKATVDLYTFGQAKFVVRDKRGRKIGKVTGHIKGNPLYLRSAPRGRLPTYPNYEIVVINGITEILEQRRPEDILYVVDDANIREELLADREVK